MCWDKPVWLEISTILFTFPFVRFLVINPLYVFVIYLFLTILRLSSPPKCMREDCLGNLEGG